MSNATVTSASVQLGENLTFGSLGGRPECSSHENTEMERPMTGGPDGQEHANSQHSVGRRDFIKGVGKFASVTPAAVTMLLEVSMNSPAVAASGGGGSGGAKPGNGFGDKNHVHTGPPGQNKKP